MPLEFNPEPRIIQERLSKAPKLTLRAAGQFGMQPTLKRSMNESDVAILVGCAVPYNRLSLDMGGFKEMYAQGCFVGSLSDPDLTVCFNHDSSKVLGRLGSRTAAFTEKSDGLWCSAVIPNTTWAR
jgi:phage head maturation protease